MASKANLTKQANITTAAREQDFVTVFNDNWEALRQIMGIMRPIRKTPGTKLVSSRAKVTLQDSVGEGEDIPYSLAEVEPVAYQDLTIEKYAKAVSIEAVAKHGAAIAVQKTDAEFQNELQKKVLARFYTFLNTGSLTSVYTTWQMALAMAKANVLDKFNKLRKTVTDVVGFCNILDAYEYIGGTNINAQTAFGINYVENFMGYSTLFLMSAPDIARGTVIAVPVENIDLYYIDPSDSDFAQLGLSYTVEGETNLVGYHANGNYNTAVGESFAIMGMSLWCEYLDGISIATVEASGSLGSVSSFSTAAFTGEGSKTGDSQLTVPDPTVAGGTYWFKAQASTAPSAPTYLETFDTTGWTQVIDDQVVATTNGHKYRVVELNGAGQAIASAYGDVTAKT